MKVSINTFNLRFSGFDDDWIKAKLNNICKVQDGTHSTPNYTDEGIPFFSVDTIINNVPPKFISLEDHEKLIKRCHPQKGDILLSRITGGILGFPKLVDWDYDFSIYVSLALLTNIEIDSKYLSYYIQSPVYRNDFLSKSLLIASPPKINLSDLESTFVNYPNIKEQEKIANFLDLVDKKTELLENKLKYYQDFKKYLMQQIFAQKLRFDKSNENQKEIQLDNVISIINKRNKDDQNLPVLSISNKLGFISQSEQFEDREVASSDKKNYKIVNKGEFAYNPARINVGSIAQLKTYEKGIISPMYIVFKIDSTQLNPTFFENFLDSDYFRYEMMKRLEGSVRMILSAESLKNIKITVPTIEEQENLSKVFLAFDKEIEIIKYQLEKMQEFKKGLLQQMFVCLIYY